LSKVWGLLSSIYLCKGSTGHLNLRKAVPDTSVVLFEYSSLLRHGAEQQGGCLRCLARCPLRWGCSAGARHKLEGC